MQEPNSHSRLKQFAIAIACLVGATAVGWGVVALLKNIETTHDTSITSTQALGATETITQYTNEGAIAELKPDIYTLQPQNEGTVIYKSTASYVINTPTQHTVLFTAKDTAHSDDTTIVQSQTTTFMEQRDYKKIDNAGSARVTQPTFTTYENDKAVCQLSSSRPEKGSSIPPFFVVSCVDKTAIQKEYSAINALLALAKNAGQSSTFTEASRATKTEGNKSLATLNLIENDKISSLLFAAIDDNWSYLGSLSDDKAESNGKFAISAEVRQAMSDPKWGDFLTKNIQ